jgi:hypothetical protein
MADAVSRLPLAEEARFRSYARLLEVCGGQSGAETGFFSKILAFLYQYHPTNAPYSFLITCCCYQKTNVRTLGTTRKQCFFGNRGALDRKIFSVFQSSESFALASCYR